MQSKWKYNFIGWPVTPACTGQVQNSVSPPHSTEVTEVLLHSSSPAADKWEWEQVSEKWTFPLFNICFLLFNEWSVKENWKASILMNHTYFSILRNFLKWEYLGREKKSSTLEYFNHQDPTKTILDLSAVWERGNLWPNESSPVPTTIWKCFSRNCSLRVWKAEEMIFMIVLGLHKGWR